MRNLIMVTYTSADDLDAGNIEAIIAAAREALARYGDVGWGGENRFGAAFGASDLCAALGLLHDAGKADMAWQQRLLEVDGTRRPVGVPHKQLGARALKPRVGPLAGCVLGHHGGLDDFSEVKPVLKGLDSEERATLRTLIDEIPEVGRQRRAALP